MLRDDYKFLEKWTKHYANITNSKNNLFVIAHGQNPEINRIAEGCNVLTIPHFENGSQFETRRRQLFFGMVQGLLAYYQHVITTDVDEYIVLDPKFGMQMDDYLNGVDFQGPAISPVGFDVVHKPSVETDPFCFERPLTSQRRHGYLEGAYCKPCIFRAAPPAGGNAHFLNDVPWQIEPDLLLFHMKYFDQSIGLELAQKRKETVLAYEKKAKTHRIGGWHNRDLKLRTTIENLESQTVTEMDRPQIEAATTSLVEAFEKRGRFPWAASQFGPFRIPERFVGLV